MSLLKTLKGQVLAISAFCLVVGLAALTVANYVVARNRASAELNAQAQALAASHAETLFLWVRNKGRPIEALAGAASEADPMPALRLIAAAGNFSSTNIGYADKRMVVSKPTTFPPDYDPRQRPWYQLAAAANGPVATKPYQNADGSGLVVSFAAAARSGGTVQAVAAGIVSLKAVADNIASIRPTPASLAFLASGDGSIVVHPDAQMVLKPTTDVAPELTADMLRQQSARTELRAVDVKGRPMLLTVVPVQGTDWLLAVLTDQHEALASVRSLLHTSVLTGAVVLLAAVLLLAAILSQRLRRLTLVRDAMREIGEGGGDLSRRIDAQGEDELAQIAGSFNGFTGKLSGVLAQIRDTSQSVRVASEEIATGNLDLSGRTELTASSLEQTSASMQQLTETVRHNADAARQANQLVAQATSVAQHGGAVVGNVVSTMEQINNASTKIADIIGVIDGIAFQTNILALNAAVEAARAGEQGRGFAVVAGEVRSLAQRSAEAAKEIKQLIGTSVEQVQAGSRLVRDAGTTMKDIVDSVQRVNDIMAEITASTGEQSTSIAEVGQAVAHLDQMTQQNAALVEQSAAAAQSLKEQSVRLTSAVGSFKLADGNHVPQLSAA